VSAHRGDRRVTTGGHRILHEECIAVVDAAGVIGVARSFTFAQGSGNSYDWRPLDEGRAVAEIAAPLVAEVATILEDAELLGRYLVSADVLGLGGMVRVHPDLPGLDDPVPPVHTTRDEITVDGSVGAGLSDVHNDLANTWGRSFARACGLTIWG
jgi:hypothetical protein